MTDDEQKQQDELGDRFGSITGDTRRVRDARDAPDAEDSPVTSDARDTVDTHAAGDTADTDDATDTPVRERKRKTLYLPADLVKELELTFDELNLRWRQAGHEPLEKHPDYYEQLLRNGLESLGDVSERGIGDVAEELGLEEK